MILVFYVPRYKAVRSKRITKRLFQEDVLLLVCSVCYDLLELGSYLWNLVSSIGRAIKARS
jgi:hypothetical protein